MHQNDRLVPRYNKCIPKDPKIRINKVQKLRINRGYNKVEVTRFKRILHDYGF